MATRTYDRLLAEDLHRGVGRVTRTHAGGGVLTGSRVGLSTFAIRGTAFKKVWEPGIVGMGDMAATQISVPGAYPGAFVMAAFRPDLQGLGISGYVSSPHNVRVVVTNHTGQIITIGAGILSVMVFRVAQIQEEIPAFDPLEASFVIDVNGQGATGGSGVQTTGWTGTPTVIGGSGSYSYLWKVWNENSSEGSPLYTSTDQIPVFPPTIPPTCVGEATLRVVDTVTMQFVDVGPEVWDWDCI